MIGSVWPRKGVQLNYDSSALGFRGHVVTRVLFWVRACGA
jgi:hypothetical protein